MIVNQCSNTLLSFNDKLFLRFSGVRHLLVPKTVDGAVSAPEIICGMGKYMEDVWFVLESEQQRNSISGDNVLLWNIYTWNPHLSSLFTSPFLFVLSIHAPIPTGWNTKTLFKIGGKRFSKPSRWRNIVISSRCVRLQFVVSDVVITLRSSSVTSS